MLGLQTVDAAEAGAHDTGYAAFDPYMEKFDGDEEPFLPVLYSGLQEHLFRERYNGTTDHLTTGTCPQCGAWVQFRSIYKGYRSLWDRLFLIEYAKSAIEPRSAIVCVGLEIDVAWKHMDGLEPDVPMGDHAARAVCVPLRAGRGPLRAGSHMDGRRLGDAVGAPARMRERVCAGTGALSAGHTGAAGR